MESTSGKFTVTLLAVAALLGALVTTAAVSSPDSAQARCRHGVHRHHRHCHRLATVASRKKTTSTTPTTTTTTSSSTSTTGATGGSGSSSCPLATPGSSIGFTVTGCQAVAADSAAGSDPLGAGWGHADCASPSQQVSWSQSGGDPSPTASGASQGNSAYRTMTAYDAMTNDSVAPSGDAYSYYGERCELGRNDHRSTSPTFVLYGEGQRRATYMSFRLPSNYPLSQTAQHPYNVIMQMKQTQPANNGGGSPMIELDAFGGQWHLEMGALSSPVVWSAPAQPNVWTRFAFDVVYSQNPSVGSVTVHADLNGDGDFADSGEQAGPFHGATLKAETSGSINSGIAPGSSIPDHLRTGVYHDIGSSGYSCPAPTGCSVNVDNVQVLGA
jgi:hypothetical protein